MGGADFRELLEQFRAVSGDLQASRIAHERTATQLEEARQELARARNERAALEQRLTRLEARGEGGANNLEVVLKWAGFLVAAAALVVSIVK